MSLLEIGKPKRKWPKVLAIGGVAIGALYAGYKYLTRDKEKKK